MKSLLNHRTWRVSLTVLAIFLPLLSYAQSSLVFERADVTITRKAAPDSAKPNPVPANYNIELRPEDALRLEYIHALNSLTPTTGVAIVFVVPTVISLPMLKVYTPVDVLFVAEDGQILQIMPKVTLSEIAQDIRAHAPIKAFLFLKAGQAQAAGIKAHDYVNGKMFTPSLPIQE